MSAGHRRYTVEKAVPKRPADPGEPAVRRGRPRPAHIDSAINKAVRAVLLESGYAALSYERVATRAGASRPTVYRRASSKAALVVNALVEEYGLSPAPDTGSIEGDLIALQRAQLRLYNDDTFGAALPGLLADIRIHVEARDGWVRGFVRPRRESVDAAVTRGMQRGELAADTDTDWVCEMLTGPLISAAFLNGPRRLPTSMVNETVTLVLNRYGRKH